MSDILVVILDTGFLVALRNEKDIHNLKATKIMEDLLKGTYGTIIVSDYIFDESITLAMIRTKKLHLVKDIHSYILKSKKIKLVFVGEKAFFEAWILFIKYFDQKLSFTDCTILALQNKFEKPSFVATFEEPLSKLVTLVPGL